MNRRILVTSLAITLSGLSVFAAAPVIGMAVSEGKLSVNDSFVDGNATLVSGTVLKTSDSPSRLQMKNGAQVVLDRNTQAKVFGDRLVLEQGVSQISGKSSYDLEALGFHVAPSAMGQARVEMQKNRVIVAALNGPVHVSDNNGMVLASLSTGRTLSFEPAVASGMSSMSGRLSQENGKFVLPDDVSGLKVELNGQGLDREVGRRIQVTGTARSSADRKSQVIEVARLNRLSDDASPEPAPSPSPAPSPVPQGGVGGLSNGAKIVIVVGVVAAVGVAAGVLATQSR